MTAVLTSVGAEPDVIQVPDWVPSGPARFESSCLEPDLSNAGDGADVFDFAYDPVPVTIDGEAPAAGSGRLTVNQIVRDGNLTVSGSDCSGRVLVTVTRGSDLLASATEFHYGRTLVTAEDDGTWAKTIPLRYSVSLFSDPMAPGPVAVFAVCEGNWYRPAHAWIASSSPAPAIQLDSFNPSQIYLGQCPAANSLLIVTVSRVGWRYHVSVQGAPGNEYGERFQNVDVPEGAKSVDYLALCTGRAAPPFLYRPAHWQA